MASLTRPVLNDTTSVSICGEQPGLTLLVQRGERSYYAQVGGQLLDEQNCLIDQLISLAFDTLGARHLDVRICAAEG